MNPSAQTRRTPRILIAAAVLLAFSSLGAVTARAAEVQVLLGVDPADSAGGSFTGGALAPSQSMTRIFGSKATVTQTSSMKEAMRASRTVENEIIIAPAHVTASAILHSYQLVALGGQEQVYVLVVRSGIDSLDKLAGKRMYLPQQDSLRSYVAKGLLTEAGLKLDQFSKLTYGNTSGGGLMAMSLDMTDATIADEAQAREWISANPGKARILKATRPVPGGMSLVVRKDFCATDCARVIEWVNSSDGSIGGAGRFKVAPPDAAAKFSYVASLGIATPEEIKGAKRVGADEVAELARRNVTIADTRSQKEYDSEHIKGSVLVPYLEKSLKETDFDASKDDFSALARLPRQSPVVFLCNGPECWKSYKASRAAVAAGFAEVYWFRGGMPEWRARRLPVESGGGAVALAKIAVAPKPTAKPLIVADR